MGCNEIDHIDGVIRIDDLENGQKRITVKMKDSVNFCPIKSCITHYPIYLIKAILDVKGPAWLCDEISRDEDPTSVRSDLATALFSYVKPIEFEGKTILDFGCGCGSSTTNIVRLLPNTSIIGVDIDSKMLDVALLRKKFYLIKKLELLLSPSPDQLPTQIRSVDFILLSAVFEHMLPNERQPLIHQLWKVLSDGGIMFINQTPDIRFPIETHTTGLPFINYLPDKLAFIMAKKYSSRVKHNKHNITWEGLLRNGIRGTTPKKIMKILATVKGRSKLLNPNVECIKNQSDIWYRASKKRLLSKGVGVKNVLIRALLLSVESTRIPIAPYLSLAIKKYEE